MAKSAPNPKVDWYFVKNKQWQEEIETLRVYALESGLSEELKWGCPCYLLDGKNVFLIHCFKEYCAYLFMKGAVMKDPKKILIQQTANVQSARQIRFTGAKEIAKLKTTLKAYIKEAIAIERSGVKVEFKKTTEFNMPEEFENKLNQDKALNKAFFSLTPGRQRGYLLYFSSAKQAATRESRIEKYTKQIIAGKGIDD